MTDSTLDDVEATLERATTLERDAALEVLDSATETLEQLADRPDVDETRRRRLADQLRQRRREVDRREEYGGELGAAMNPDDEDAP